MGRKKSDPRKNKTAEAGKTSSGGTAVTLEPEPPASEIQQEVQDNCTSSLIPEPSACAADTAIAKVSHDLESTEEEEEEEEPRPNAEVVEAEESPKELAAKENAERLEARGNSEGRETDDSSPTAENHKPDDSKKEKIKSLFDSLSQMSVARPTPQASKTDKDQEKERKNAARAFPSFLLRVNANKNATVGGIITFSALVVISIALHVLILDLIGLSNLHANRFDLSNVKEIAIELIPPDPPAPEKKLDQPVPRQDSVDTKSKSTPTGTPESWPIDMPRPGGARIARESDLNTTKSQLGESQQSVTSATAPQAAGVSSGSSNQTSSKPGNSFASPFDSDGGSSGGLNGTGGSTTGGTGMEDDRTMGTFRPTIQRNNGALMFRFPYQTFFKPEFLPAGKYRKKPIDGWTDGNFKANVENLENIFSDMDDSGLGASPELYVPLVALASYTDEDTSARYKKKFIDMTEQAYGRFSADATVAKVIMLETEHNSWGSVSQANSLKNTLAFELDKQTLQMALVHRCLGNIFIAGGKPAEAQAEYDKSISIMESLPQDDKVIDETALTKISLACVDIEYLDNQSEANELLSSVKSYKKSCKFHPWLIPMCDLLSAEIFRKQNRFDDAEDLLKKVRATTPKNIHGSTVWHSLAYAAALRLEELDDER